MPTQYERGRNFEYRIKAYLEKKGYRVIRSAGSHTPIDLIAGDLMRANTSWGIAVQCKGGKERMTLAKRLEFYQWAESFGCEAYIVTRDKSRSLVWSQVNEKGGLHASGGPT
jgi:Holliday junction resolvase